MTSSKIGPQIGIDFSALDPNFKEHSTRGIGKYAREFKKYLEKKNMLNASEDSLSISFFDHQEITKNSNISKLIDYSPVGKQTIKQQILYPLLLGSRLKRFSHLHFLAQTDAPSWSPKPYILTVMDLIPLVMADLYKADNPNWRYKLARFFESRAILNADKIITISQCSKNDIIKFYNINPEKIHVTPLGVDSLYFKEYQEDYSSLELKYKLPAKQNYLFYVGGIDPRKNYSDLLHTYQKLKQIYLDKDKTPPMLYLAGSISKDKEYPRFNSLLKNLGISNEIKELGYVKDEELPLFYKNSEGLCFFSLYEGFGLTPLEALASGARVFCNKVSAMPEVLANFAEYVDSSQHNETALKIYDLIENEDQDQASSRIAKAKQHASDFSWDKTWDLTCQIYSQYES